MTNRREIAVVSIAMMVVSACSGAEPVAAPSAATPSSVPPTQTTATSVPHSSTVTAQVDASEPLTIPPVADAKGHTTLVAQTLGETQVFESPDASEPMLVLPAKTIIGTETVLAVVDVVGDGWVLVQLPIRPNGSTGWVQDDDVEFFEVTGRIVVDLGERVLSYFVAGEEVLSAQIAVGSERNPTPTGSFFVTDSVTLANPESPWGPHALGLSAYSDTITEYNGGPGIIGIHGTNKPDSIGTASSLGCVRMPNELITLLHSMVPIGTPVEIKA